ncbi:MAG: glucosyl-3-phosphoglycerate synthase [Akkermansiaceae bacterium]|nr:glucosyl-3-phosphoglycerate synthase [Akkermansiaceae bacterium]
MSWLKRNTFHHSDFSDLAALCEAKQEAGITVSLCIPTLNEEKTIGKEIVIFKSELMDRFPLIDEFAVIDSGSTDATGEIVQSYGADFYYSGDILPSEGFKRGKGENLWKAIYQLKSDIICYVDADIANIHPRFVYGLVGPLLRHPEMHYVKAFYERPMAFSEGIRATGGGRVTEILVRPLFSLFYPELTQLFQPLSGEYAVRREVLERIPFPIGYGVETSHLLDVYLQWGMGAFGQTDLDQRVHRNQSTAALGKMSFGILQSFLHRLQKHGKASAMADISNTYRALQANGSEYEEITTEIIEEERPPMIEIKEYLERFPR